MKRVIVVYNPKSSRYADVRAEVLDRLQGLKGYMVGKYEVRKGGFDENVAELAKILKAEDIIIAAGGDATGAIVMNAIMRSGKEVTLAALPYGNFNDLARTLGTKAVEDVLGVDEQNVSGCRVGKLYPFEVIVDGKLARYASCYVTMGMTAEAVKMYDSPKMRKKLKTKCGRTVGSYTELVKWYFKNRWRQFLPEFELNGVLQPQKMSDYLAVNGKSMARVMKGGDDWSKPRVFRSVVRRLTGIFQIGGMMMKSMMSRVPGDETEGDVLKLVEPGRVEIQAEGELMVFENATKIEIKKADQYLRVVTRS